MVENEIIPKIFNADLVLKGYVESSTNTPFLKLAFKEWDQETVLSPFGERGGTMVI